MSDREIRQGRHLVNAASRTIRRSSVSDAGRTGLWTRTSRMLRAAPLDTSRRRTAHYQHGLHVRCRVHEVPRRREQGGRGRAHEVARGR